MTDPETLDARRSIDPLALSKSIDEPYRNLSLGLVNDHEIRMSVMTGSFPWHRHPDSDETFYGIDGELIIEFLDGVAVLRPGQFLTVPAGTLCAPIESCSSRARPAAIGSGERIRSTSFTRAPR